MRWHIAKILSPALFEKFRQSYETGVQIIYGVTGDPPAEETKVQAIQLDPSFFTADEAKEWLAKHGYAGFEFTTGVAESEHGTEDVVILGAELKEALLAEGQGEGGGEADGSRWRVQLVEAGLSVNGNVWPLAVLREAAPLFDGVRALARTDEDHLQNRGKRVRDIVGWFSGPKANDAGVEATFNVSEAAPWLRTMSLDAFRRGKRDLFGFSLVAEASFTLQRAASGAVQRVVRGVKRVRSVDVVVDPSAGGKILGLAESQEKGAREMKGLEKLLALIEAQDPAGYATLDKANLDMEKVAMLAEAILAKARPAAPAPAAPGAATVDATALAALVAEAVKPLMETVNKRFAERDTATLIEAQVAKAKLPAAASKRIRSMLGDAPTEAQITEAITAEREYLDGARPRFRGPGSATVIESVVDEMDKWKTALDGFFAEADQPLDPANPTGRKIPRGRSIRDLYVSLTGDTDVTGQVQDAPNVGLTAEAAITASTFAGALGDSIRRQMQREYAQAPYTQWRAIADVVPIKDFRTNYRPQMGGFSSLASVAPGDPYVAFTTAPDDFTPSYAVTKYGRLQEVYLETIANDDVGVMLRIPRKIARAAQRTLNAAAWAPLVSNGTFGPDTTALFHADHANLTTSPLSMGAVLDGIEAMMAQTEPQSGERLNIGPKYLCVPSRLREMATALCYSTGQPVINVATPAASDAPSGRPNFIARLGIEPIFIPHTSDDQDWFLAADRMDIPLIEVGFLGGREEPELYVQDAPTSGSMFSNDVLTYKVRHVWGVCILDYRGLYGGVVA